MSQASKNNPAVFISYTWEDDEHNNWVSSLSDQLVSDRVNVILDKYNMKAGKNLFHFVEDAITRSDYILIIFTPKYKLRAEERNAAAGYEYSIIHTWLSKNIASQEKIIPILKKGTVDESIPLFMQQFINLDFSNENYFKESYEDLLRIVHGNPKTTSTSSYRHDLKQVEEYSEKKTNGKYRTIIIATSISFIAVFLVILVNNKDKTTQTERLTVTAQRTEPISDSNRKSATLSTADHIRPTLLNNHKPPKELNSINETRFDFEYGAVNGYKRVSLNGKYGFIDKNRNNIDGAKSVELKYDYAEDFSEGMAMVTIATKCGFIGIDGKIAIDLRYDNARSFAGGKARVQKNGRWFYIDKSGRCVEDCPGDE